MSNRIQSILVFLSCVFMITMTGLSNAGVFGGRTVEEISYTPHEILVPAGYTFSIWGIIYIGMIVFAFYQLKKSTLNNDTMQKIRPWVGFNFLANGLWLPAATVVGWTWITVALILFMWISLGHINKNLQGYAHTKATKGYITMPMSIYFGRITIATPLNIASVLNEWGFSPAVQSEIRILVWIGLAYITSLIVFYKLRYLSYIAVLLRALLGVLIARWYDAPHIAWITILLLIATITYIIVRAGQKKIIIQ